MIGAILRGYIMIANDRERVIMSWPSPEGAIMSCRS
jgi:hypothetical protein